MQRLHIHGRSRLGLYKSTKDSRSTFQKLRAPLRDLVRVNVELMCQLGQRLLALDGRQRHLRLEGRAVVPARSSRHGVSSLSASCRCRADDPLNTPVQISQASSLMPAQIGAPSPYTTTRHEVVQQRLAG